MRIVFLQDDFPPVSFGGAGFSVYELAQGMRKAGHEVSVVTTVRHTKEAGRIECKGLTIYRIASDYSGRWRSYVSINNRPVVREVEKILRELKPDVVHANNIHAHLSYASLKVAKRYAKAVVWTARDAMSFNYGKLVTERYLERLDAHTTWLDHIRQAGKRWNPLRNLLIRRYLRYADTKCAVSDALARALEQNNIFPVSTVHTGIDSSTWKVPEQVSYSLRTRYGLQNKRIVFFGGRLNAAGQVLEAFAHVATDISDAVLVIAGREDAFAEGIKEEARRLGVEQRLVWTGWITGEKLKAAYAASNVVLVPSTYFDSLPRTVLEGMAAGKPVVATRYGGASEAVRDGQTGYVIDPRELRQIAERLSELLKYPEKAARMGEAGRERIRTHFSLERMVGDYLRRYDAILRAPR